MIRNVDVYAHPLAANFNAEQCNKTCEKLKGRNGIALEILRQAIL